MFKDLLEILKDLFKKLLTSRLFALSIVFTVMFCALIIRLFDLQIVHGEEYLDGYIALTKKDIKTSSTRGNIYDRNGNVLAYNELAYSVTVQDTGDYTRNNEWNLMLMELVEILDKHGETVQGNFEVAVNYNGEMVYTTSSEAARKRFLRDLYGLKKVEELDDEKGEYPSRITPRELFGKMKVKYGLDQVTDEDGQPLDISDDVALKIINIRYTMRFTAFQKYETTTVSVNVSDEAVADIMEHASGLKGVNIEEDTVRVYNDSVYFSSVIGYTGKVMEERLEELKAEDPDYELNDIVGRTGIEASMETELQGTKGSRTIYVDNVGRILEVADEKDPVAGNDIYLTLDRDLQIATYNLLEKQLAGILTKQLVNADVDETTFTDSSKIPIPIKDAYFQLINNNVLSVSQFASPEASDIEHQIHAKFLDAQTRTMDQMRNELMSGHPTLMKDLSPEMAAYMQYVYTYLSDPSVGIVLRNNIDMNSDEYLAWTEQNISLRDFIYYGIANNWIDTTKLEIKSRYSNADDVFSSLVDYIFEHLSTDNQFTKKIYRYLINDETVTGRELCLALYSQNVLAYDDNEVRQLTENGNSYAFTFLINKISNLEITPAQLALDPCTAGCVVTDVRTGEVRAIVSYPSYDNNRISEPAYLSQLMEDLSLPLRNNATQTKKAPGSTFKPISAVAALEENVISLYDTINCTGIYEEVEPPIKCWIYYGHHGPLNVVGGIENSCNYFFADVGHRLSMDENGVYSTEKGIETIRKYATMFGLDHTSGVEISEAEPEITTEAPERSAMGQGTHSYSNIQLSRYVSVIANRGTVFELSLLDKVTDSKGNLLKDYTPKVYNQLEIQDSTWDAVQQGMRQVITNGSAKQLFKDLAVPIAGKTGTAQESKKRSNHAFFVSYAPFDNPEIAVTVNIPNGYSSSHAATVAKNVYSYYYKYTSLEQILNTGALDASNVEIRD